MCPGQTLCRALQTKMDKPAISSEKSEHDINGFFPNTPLSQFPTFFNHVTPPSPTQLVLFLSLQ